MPTKKKKTVWPFHRVVRAHRSLLALTQKQMAKRTGITYWRLVRIESGEISTPTLGDINALGKVCGWPPTTIHAGTKPAAAKRGAR